ncbi:type II toxin-antitoxin system HipA family toxin [Nocardia takedensis]
MTDPTTDFRRIAHADVYKDGVHAARLGRTPDGGTEFRYLAEYVSAGADPVATTLPLTSDPVRSRAGAVPPFFEGLLPEGHRLTVLRRMVKTSADDELSLLLAVGTDVPGDVQVVPADRPPHDTAPLISGASPAELDFAEIADRVDPHAIPGVQRKASASMISVPIAADYGRFILKLSQPEYPHLIENEAAHLAAAREMNIGVARAELVSDRAGEPGLLVGRFDRFRDGDRWGRLAFEDAAQVLGLPPAAKYQVDAVEVVLALAAVTSAPQIALRNLYLQFVFAWLTGNGDLHAKNAGVLRGHDGAWSVAPIYDIPCTLVYGDDTSALPLAGRTRRLRTRDWAGFADAIGLPERAAESANQVALRAAAAVDLARLPFHGSPLHRAQRELRSRRREFGIVER